MGTEFVFPSIEILIKIMTNLSKKEMTKLRIEKLIYFSYAYYGAFALEKEDYQKNLVDIAFTCDEYGFHIVGLKELISSNFSLIQDKEYSTEDEFMDFLRRSLSKYELEILELIIDIVKQTDDMGDFSLVEINHTDNIWFDCYNNKKVFSNKDLYLEYQTKIKRPV